MSDVFWNIFYIKSTFYTKYYNSISKFIYDIIFTLWITFTHMYHPFIEGKAKKPIPYELVEANWLYIFVLLTLNFFAA